MLTNSNKGKFILIEGIDNAGTTTQTKMVAATLTKLGYKVTTLKEPDDSKKNPVGRNIRKILNRELPNPGHRKLQEMYVDSREHLEINVRSPYHKLGFSSINDRAHPSTFAYGKASGQLTFDDVKHWHDERNLFLADIAFLIDTPVAECFRRRGTATADIMEESRLFQEKVRQAYLDLFVFRPDCVAVDCHIIRGMSTPDRICQMLTEQILDRFPDLPRHKEN